MIKWLLTITLLICFVSIGIYIEKPTGSLSGKLNLEAQSFDKNKKVYNTNDIKNKAVRIMAYGQVTRASYVNNKGEFRIDNLPVGNYSVSYKADGYESQTKWDVKVEEAKVKYLPVVNLNFMTPSLSIASDMKVFTTKEHPYFWVKTTGLKNLKLNLYKFQPEKHFNFRKNKLEDYESFLLGNYYYGSKDLINDLIKNDAPILRWQKKVNIGLEDTASTPFKITDSLPEGCYLLTADADPGIKNSSLTDIYWFSISKIGIISKQDPGKILFRAINLENLRGEENVNIKIFDKYDNLKIIGRVNTDKNGLGTFIYPKTIKSGSSSIMLLGKSGNSYAIGSSYSWSSSNDKYKVYFYTERPIYRPNQTVYFKGILRERVEDGFKNIANKNIIINVTNPDDEKIKTINLRTNEYGTYNGLISIPEDSKLGNYKVTTVIDGNEYENFFEVNEYRKPEYKVEVIPGSEILVGGNTANATVKATYLFGYPVANAKVKYTVYASPDYSLKWKLLPRPDYYSFYDNWGDDDSYYYTGYEYTDSSGQILSEGYANTDENGEAKISFNTNKIQVSPDSYFDYDNANTQKYRIEAEVTDISRKTAVGSGNFDVVSGDFALFIEPDSYVYSVNQDIKVNINSIGFNKKPVSTQVNLQLQKWTWNEETYEYVNPKNISETTIVTNDNGEGVATFKVPSNTPTTTYKIVAQTKDSSGNEISTANYVWISNLNYPSACREKKSNLQFTFDKKVYKPGDIAKIMVVSPIKNIEALISLEGEKIYNYKLVNLNSYMQLVEIPIEKKYVPNAYVSVLLVGDHKQFYEQTKMLKVSPDNNFLKLDLKPDKAKYNPQDKVTYTIKATDSNGNPAQVELSFGVVDESIYLVREDFTPNIRTFFYERRSNQVQTEYTFAANYSAGADKIQPRVRKDFKDTAFWKANITTNKNGTAKVSFKVPDNLTTWRTTVRAITKDTKVASAIDKIIVTKDIIVRLALPRFYTVGDKPVLATIVHNYTDKPLEAQLKIKLPNNFIVNDLIKKTDMFVTVPSQGQYRKDWNLIVKKSGNAKIQALALSSRIEGDAVEQDIRILPYGVPKTSSVSGKLDNNNTNKLISEKIKNKTVPGSLNWQLRLSPSNAGMLLGSLDYLVDYPYGCTEQTMSKFLPSIIVGNLSQNMGLVLSDKTKEKLPKVIKDSISRLYNLQHADGAWGWWKTDQSSPYMTAYVLLGLKYAQNYNYPVRFDKLDNGLRWIRKYMKDANSTNPKDNNDALNDKNLSDSCFVAYVASMYGIKDEKYLQKLYEKYKFIPNEGLAYLALANAELGYNSKANEMIDNLLSRVNIALPIVSFGNSINILQKIGINIPDFYDYNSVEVTSTVLRAMLKVRSNDPLIEQIVPFISNNRSDNYWYNTKTTSNVILALAEYIKMSAYKDNTDCDVIIKLNNKQIKTLHFDRSNLFTQETVINIPEKSISKSNKLYIEKIGQGNVYYSSNLNYYELFAPDETIPAVETNGIKVTKEFFNLKSTLDKEGNIKYEEVPFNNHPKAGEILLVKLVLENTKPISYVMLEDYKASGMEVVSDDPRAKLGDNFDSSDDENQKDYWWDFWWSNQENKDEKMVFFANYLKPGKHIFKYLIRPEIPGEYLMNPAYAGGMYSTFTRGSTASMKLNIVE